MAGLHPVSLFAIAALVYAVAVIIVLVRWLVEVLAVRFAPEATAGSQFEPLITAGAVADATIAGMPLAEAALTMNDHVFDALERWVVHTHDPWSLVDYIKEHHATVFAPDNGFLDGLKGYVAESIVGDHFAALGHNVVLATTTNQPGWDLLIDGHQFQVKAGSTAAQAVHEHFATYPNVPVIASPEAAAHLSSIDPHAILAVHEIGNAQLTETTAHTLHGLEAVGHVGAFHLPVVTIAVSAYREIGILIDGHTTFVTAAAHVATNAVGVGAGIMVGAKAGAAAGAWTGTPHGVAAGGFIGGVFGAIAGKFGAKAINQRRLRATIEEYTIEVKRAQAQFGAARQQASMTFTTSMRRWNNDLARERTVYRRSIDCGQRRLLKARRDASQRLRTSARWAALLHPVIWSDVSAALDLMNRSPSEGASVLASIADRMDEHAYSAIRLRRHIAELVVLYKTTSAYLDDEAQRYTALIERYDVESRIMGARLLAEMGARAQSLFARASELMDEISRESRALGKPVATPRLALPPPSSASE